jgi:hypothetical protein
MIGSLRSQGTGGRTMRTALLVLAITSAGCAAPQGRYVTPTELAAIDRADAESNASPAGSRSTGGFPGGVTASVPIAMPGDDPTPKEAEEKHDALQDRLVKLERRRQDLDRARPALDARRASQALEHQSDMAAESISVAKAERGHRIATEDLMHFVEVEQARRLAEDVLSIQGSADRLLETREELAQLEMMYGESGLGDATAEIVLNRTRRRLSRAEEGHRLRVERSAELVSIEIPREIEELQLAVRAAGVELENARRKAERGALERTADLADLEDEQLELDREDEDIARDAERIERDLARAGRRAPPPSLLASRTGVIGTPR